MNQPYKFKAYKQKGTVVTDEIEFDTEKYDTTKAKETPMPNPPMNDEELREQIHEIVTLTGKQRGRRQEAAILSLIHQRETAPPDKDLLDKVSYVVTAFTDKGSHPDYHDEQMRHLETHWPSLYFAVRDLAALTDEQSRKRDCDD